MKKQEIISVLNEKFKKKGYLFVSTKEGDVIAGFKDNELIGMITPDKESMDKLIIDLTKK